MMNPGYFILIVFAVILTGWFIFYELFFWFRSPFGWKKVMHDTGDYYFILERKNGYNDRFNLKMAKFPIYLFTSGDVEIYESESTNLITMKRKFDDFITKHLQSIEDVKDKKDKYRSLKKWDGNIMTTQGNRDRKLKNILK